MQYLCTKKLIAGRSWPRDVSVCLEGNLATVVSACLATLLGSCHSPPGSLWGSEWGGGWGWGESSSSHNWLLLVLKTKDYNENVNCLQPLHGVHHLRNVLLLWETPTHDQRSGDGSMHVHTQYPEYPFERFQSITNQSEYLSTFLPAIAVFIPHQSCLKNRLRTEEKNCCNCSTFQRKIARYGVADFPMFLSELRIVHKAKLLFRLWAQRLVKILF